MYIAPAKPLRHRARRVTSFVVLAIVGFSAPSFAQTDPATPPPAEAPAPAPEPAPAPAPAAEPTPALAPADAQAAPLPASAAPATKLQARKAAAAKRRAARAAAARRAATASSRNQQMASGPIPRGGALLDVSIGAQSMRIYKGGKLYRTVPVSTGSGKRYCEKGKCGVAVTPRGTYRIYSYIRGWRTAQLGKLYNPLYFKGGYAVHGGRLPGYPASHGCVRVSYGTSSWLPSVAPVGSTVRIH